MATTHTLCSFQALVVHILQNESYFNCSVLFVFGLALFVNVYILFTQPRRKAVHLLFWIFYFSGLSGRKMVWKVTVHEQNICVGRCHPSPYLTVCDWNVIYSKCSARLALVAWMETLSLPDPHQDLENYQFKVSSTGSRFSLSVEPGSLKHGSAAVIWETTSYKPMTHFNTCDTCEHVGNG